MWTFSCFALNTKKRYDFSGKLEFSKFRLTSSIIIQWNYIESRFDFIFWNLHFWSSSMNRIWDEFCLNTIHNLKIKNLLLVASNDVIHFHALFCACFQTANICLDVARPCLKSERSHNETDLQISSLFLVFFICIYRYYTYKMIKKTYYRKWICSGY